MEQYTPAQWLLIDLASQYGLDKKLFPERLEFGRSLLPLVEQAGDDPAEIKLFFQEYIAEADEPEMFCASLLAVSDVLRGRPIGYTVGLDAASSGPQLLSVLCRCLTGMMNTGAIDCGQVPDLYSLIRDNLGFKAERTQVKKATVPYVYGSKREPLNVFGEDLYPKFIKAYATVVPWAEWAKNTLINCWNSFAEYHEWDTPDGGVAHVKVIRGNETKGYFQGRQYTYTFKEIGAKEVGDEGTRSLGANVTHSYDGYILRELHRRCNYNKRKVLKTIRLIENYLNGTVEIVADRNIERKQTAFRLQALSKRFNTTSVRILDFLDSYTIQGMNTDYLDKVLYRLKAMLQHEPFEVRTIHDEFAACPNHVQQMKLVYNILLGEAYESTWLFDVIEDLSGISYHKDQPEVDPSVLEAILDNNYALN